MSNSMATVLQTQSQFGLRDDFNRNHLQTLVILQVPPIESDIVLSKDKKHLWYRCHRHRHRKKNRHQKSISSSVPVIIDKTTRGNTRSKEQSYADVLERLIIEKSIHGRRSSRHSIMNNENNLYRADKYVPYEEHDDFLKDIVAKLEGLRSKKKSQYVSSSSSRDVDQLVFAGLERIVERRFYVKKTKFISNRNELTSTTDLTFDPKKIRQLSGESFQSVATSACSQCLSSTPTYVEDLRNQSDSVRNELNELRTEIEQLRTTQGQFFHQLTMQLRATQNSNQPSISPPETKPTVNQPVIPQRNSERLRSVSTESVASSSSHSETESEVESPARIIASPVKAPIPPKRPIAVPTTESIPLPAPTPSVKSSPQMITPTVIPTGPPIPIASPKESVRTPITPTPPIESNPPSTVVSVRTSPAPTPRVASTPPIAPHPPSTFLSVRTSPAPTPTVASTPPIARHPPSTVVSVRTSPAPTPTVASTPPIEPQSPPTLPSRREPVYENELPIRQVLSPRSQIVSSSSSNHSSPSSSLRTLSDPPSPYGPIPQQFEQPSDTNLSESQLNDLSRYSTQLQRTSAAIENSNLNGIFWGSVDQYLDETKRSNRITGLPPLPRPNSLNRQLDKYDLEIKQQKIVESSAPLLMPPSDLSPSTIIITNGQQIPLSFPANSEVAKLLAWSNRINT